MNKVSAEASSLKSLVLIKKKDVIKINIIKTMRGFFKINDWYIFENITKYTSYI